MCKGKIGRPNKSVHLKDAAIDRWTTKQWGAAKASLLQEIIYCVGCNVPEPWWPVAELLVADGKITLSGTIDPDKYYKRGELVVQ